MAVDVIGRNPTSGEGEYFLCNICAWPALATFVATAAPELVTAAAPELAGDFEKWGYFDGCYGLDAAESIQLANLVEKALSNRSFVDYFEAVHPSYSVRLVPEFVAFLRECGGFRIW